MNTNPPSERAIVLTPRLLWAFGSIAAMIAGSLGPWITFGPISVSGTGDGRDGIFTLILAVVAAVLIISNRGRPVVGLLAGAALTVAVIDGTQVIRSREDTFIGSIEIGWGLIVLAPAAASLLAWAITEYARTGVNRRTSAWALGGTAVAIIGTVGALAASGRFDTLEETDDASADRAELAEPVEKPKSKATCDALGINRVKSNEGDCVDENGWSVRVVNGSSLLRLDDISVSLIAVEPIDGLRDLAGDSLEPDGQFVRVTVKVHNSTRAPIDISSRMFLLGAADTTNQPDDDALVEGLIGGETLGPDLARTGDVIFDVSRKIASSLTTDGNLVVFQPSDDGAPDDASKRVGFIRTYGDQPVSGESPSATAADSTYLGCGSRSDYTATVKPRDCFLGWPDLSLADAVGLRRIRWTSWGGTTASAKAVWKTKTYDPWNSARVRAFGRQQCDNSTLYTRVRVYFANGYKHVWKTPSCRDVSSLVGD